MAILPSHPGIKITIVDSREVAFQEYPDADADNSDKVVSTYIEATSGTEFGIRWEITSPWPAHTLLLYPYVDGKPVDGTYCLSDNYGRQPYVYTSFGARSMVSGERFIQKFAFAALDIGKHTNDENSQLLIPKDDSAVTRRLELKDIKGTGEIQVKAHFVKNLVQSASTNSYGIQDSARLGKISEKALKGQSLSHQTVFVTHSMSHIHEDY